LEKNKSKIKNCKKIKLLLTDVDGVLTDGGRYYTIKGEEMKKFHVQDGMGVNLLLKNHIKTIIVSKENSKIVKKWAKEMNVYELLMNIKKKESILPKICKKYNVANREIAFIGDDVNDIELLKKVGFSATPNDGNQNVKKIVDYVCENNGGKGAFREVSDQILKTKFPTKMNWY